MSTARMLALAKTIGSLADSIEELTRRVERGDLPVEAIPGPVAPSEGGA